MPELWDAIMGQASPQQNFAANQPYVAQPGRTDFNTQLPQMDEFQFRNWVAQHNVPFNPNATAPQDYDMRGYWQGLMQQNPRARPTEINPNDMQPHYTDYWKTPYHQSFSAGSQYAGAVAPQWVNSTQLASPGGRILFDETQR